MEEKQDVYREDKPKKQSSMKELMAPIPNMINNLTRPPREEGFDYSKEAENTCCYGCMRGVLYWWRHPALRVVLAIALMCINLVWYTVDPVAESRRKTYIPVSGACWHILFVNWPSEVDMIFARIFTILLCLTVGPMISWYLIHGCILRDCLKFRMFGYWTEEEIEQSRELVNKLTEDEAELKKFMEERGVPEDKWESARDALIADRYKGSWFIISIFGTLIGWVIIQAFNDAVEEKYRITEELGFSEMLYAQMAIVSGWGFDAMTIWMVIDSILQDYNHYSGKGFSRLDRMRELWASKTFLGPIRIVLVWSTVIVGLVIVGVNVFEDSEERFGRWEPETNDHARVWIISAVFTLDLCLVLQDWDFPTFENPMNLDIVGLNRANIVLNADKNSWFSFVDFRINGKWANYAPMVCMIMLDLNSLYSVLHYEPWEFSQYKNPEDEHIWTLTTRSEADEPTLDELEADYFKWEDRVGQCIGFNEQECIASEVCTESYDYLKDEHFCGFKGDVRLTATSQELDRASRGLGGILVWTTAAWFICVFQFLHRNEHVQGELRMESRGGRTKMQQMADKMKNALKFKNPLVNAKSGDGDIDMDEKTG